MRRGAEIACRDLRGRRMYPALESPRQLQNPPRSREEREAIFSFAERAPRGVLAPTQENLRGLRGFAVEVGFFAQACSTGFSASPDQRAKRCLPALFAWYIAPSARCRS